jgi:hypothetical protein
MTGAVMGSDLPFTTRVRFIEQPPAYTIDGAPLDDYAVGGVYDVPSNIASIVIGMGLAIVASANEPLSPPAPGR